MITAPSISASLVLYEHKADEFMGAIHSYLNGHEGRLWVVDNSCKPIECELFVHPRVHYIFAGSNLGFGRAHNLALSASNWCSDIHLFLNPDTAFSAEVIPKLLACFQLDNQIGALMPKIEYPNGELQRLCKLLPTPVDLIFRRFIPFPSVRDKINHHYELHALQHDKQVQVPCLSGCFLLARTALLKEVEGFDQRYFMYMEDVDLVRRLGDHAKVVYEPSVTVVHRYAKGSYSNPKLLSYHLKSAVQYFNKWGWILDKDRRIRNKTMLANL